MVQQTRKTMGVARLLGVPYHVVITLVRSSKIPAPEKDEAGDFQWTEQDIERARQVIAARRKKREIATPTAG
jgi:hypothetical protein